MDRWIDGWIDGTCPLVPTTVTRESAPKPPPCSPIGIRDGISARFITMLCDDATNLLLLAGSATMRAAVVVPQWLRLPSVACIKVGMLGLLL